MNCVDQNGTEKISILFSIQSTTMGWLSMSLLGILLASVNMQPLEFDVEKNEDVGEFLVDLFVAGTVTFDNILVANKMFYRCQEWKRP